MSSSVHLPILPSSAAPTTTALAAANPDKSETVFLCRKCWLLFDNPNNDLNEFSCPECQTLLSVELRARWMAGVCAANHTELSPEARARIGAAHRGNTHPRGAQTPQDKYRVSKGNWKHGAFARKHLLPRAAHGRLAACATCPFASSSVNPQGDGRCLDQRWVDCAVAAPEIFAFFAARHGQGIEIITDLIGDLNARQLFLARMAVNDIFSNGLTLTERTEKTYADGSSSVDERVKLNPALDGLGILVRNLNGTGLAEQQLTPKSQVDGRLTADLSDTLDLLTGRIRGNLAAAVAPASLPESSD